MNDQRKTYVLKASLLCLSLFCGGTLTCLAQNNVKSTQSTMQTRKAGVVAKGQVVDDIGEPLPGATVKVRGTKIGTTTDKNGRFSLAIPDFATDKTYYLDINFVGMKKKSVRFHENSNGMRIAMESDENTLDEVEIVETGYGRLPRKIW